MPGVNFVKSFGLKLYIFPALLLYHVFIFSFSLMVSLALTLLTVGIVTAITTIPTQTVDAAEKIYCPEGATGVVKCFFTKSDCESVLGKGGCEKRK